MYTLPYLLDNGVLIDGSQGTIVDSLSNTFGCDSVITLNLIIKQPSFSTINITNCGEYTLNGSTYTSTGQYTQTLIDANAVGTIAKI